MAEARESGSDLTAVGAGVADVERRAVAMGCRRLSALMEAMKGYALDLDGLPAEWRAEIRNVESLLRPIGHPDSK